ICDRYSEEPLATVTYYGSILIRCSANEYCTEKDQAGYPVGLGTMLGPFVFAKEAELFTKGMGY
ncbi:MAG: hypothetical protein V1870_03310, partial [Candidatus Aenigmatarchaeota archaeon]